MSYFILNQFYSNLIYNFRKPLIILAVTIIFVMVYYNVLLTNTSYMTSCSFLFCHSV